MLIGLTGKARSGKDSTCHVVKDWGFRNGRVVVREGFADRLKMSAMAALGYSGSRRDLVAQADRLKEDGFVAHFLGTSRKEITGREFLQRYGTEAHRDVFDTDFWIDAVLPRDRHKFEQQFAGILVITDCRFENEAQRIRDLGGEVWEMVRPDATPIKEQGHISETRLPDDLIDRTIINDRTLDHLRDKVLSILERKVYVT